MDARKSVQEAPTHCAWCMIRTERSSKIRLISRGAHYCSRGCYLAENYEKFQNAAIFILLFTIFFPYLVLSPYPGDSTPFLRYFTRFYIVFGTGFLILFFLADRARSFRMVRPKKSRIGS